MAVPAANAVNAYAQMAQIGSGPAKPSPGQAQMPDFGALVEQALNGVVDSGKASEAAAAQAVSGQGNMVEVVTAVAESELALETLVSVRDRVISAYEEIIRMPI